MGLNERHEAFEQFIQTLQSQGLAQRIQHHGIHGFSLTPGSASSLAGILKKAGQSGICVALNSTDLAGMKHPVLLSLSRMNAVRRYAVEDFMIEVESGITMGELSSLLAEKGQACALNYPESMQLIDVLSEETAALESCRKGLPRDTVLKVETATPDGTVTISGADVVKNATGYDLAKLHIGSYGTFGVITAVTLKVFPKPEQHRQFLYTSPNLMLAIETTQMLQALCAPFSAEEVVYQNGNWCIFIELQGNAQVLGHFEEKLPQPPEGTRLEHSEQNIRPQFDIERPKEHTVIEITVPLSAWADLLVTVEKQTAIQNALIGARPSLGLIYIVLPTISYATLSFLQKEARQVDGFLQIKQVSKQDATFLGDSTNGLKAFNCPDSTVLCALLKDLKNEFDPDRVLYTPRMPL